MDNLWVKRNRNSKAVSRIVCFPHAGGSSSFFKNWASHFPLSEICSIRYPGRDERIDEDQPNNLVDLANNISIALEQFNDLPLILFGHSMGAAVSFETARFLENKGIEVNRIFASGSRNGPIPEKKVYIEEDDESLCKHLVEMGGTSSEIISDPIFWDLILPSIQTDGKMFHEYEATIDTKIACPITTIYGDHDIYTDIRPWSAMTTGSFSEEIVSGDHFYLISSPPYDLISNQIREVFPQRLSHAY